MIVTEQRQLVLFELNEVPLSVLRDYAKSRPGSTLAKMLAEGDLYETVCPDTVTLDPWISWPTLHRGVPDVTHGVLHLGQESAADDTHPTIWRRLSKAGISTGVFASLHSSSDDPSEFSNYEFFVPDYFTTRSDAWPRFMTGFQQLNTLLTRASARNVSTSLPPRATVEAAATFLRLGISWPTISETAKQLRNETKDSWTKVRRRNIQSALMGDLFMRLHRRFTPQFATFYTNNVAAAMHRFWSATYPSSFDENMGAAWIERYADEIFVALDTVDSTLADLTAQLGPYGHVMLASSMGQGPIPFDTTEGYHVISDVGRFFDAIGVERSTWEERPAMVPCRSITFDSDQSLEHFTNAMERVTMNGEPFHESDKPIGPASYAVDRSGRFVHLFVHVEGEDSVNLAVDGVARETDDFGIDFLAYDDGVNNTAQHIREGSLILFPGVKDNQSEAVSVSSLDVVPSILRFFGLQQDHSLPGLPSIVLTDEPLDLTFQNEEVTAR